MQLYRWGAKEREGSSKERTREGLRDDRKREREREREGGTRERERKREREREREEVLVSEVTESHCTTFCGRQNYMSNSVCNSLKSSITPHYVIRREGVNSNEFQLYSCFMKWSLCNHFVFHYFKKNWVYERIIISDHQKH